MVLMVIMTKFHRMAAAVRVVVQLVVRAGVLEVVGLVEAVVQGGTNSAFLSRIPAMSFPPAVVWSARRVT